jgi:hypothetical protein
VQSTASDRFGLVRQLETAGAPMLRLLAVLEPDHEGETRR